MTYVNPTMQTQLGGLLQCSWISAVALVVSLVSPAYAGEPPTDWIDPATGHRVIRLSTEPGTKSLYFHQYPFSADGNWMVMTKPRGLAAVNLQTREVKSLVEGRVQMLMTGRKTGDAFYLQGDEVQAVSFESAETRTVARIPSEYRWPSIAVNANETLLVGGCQGSHRTKQT